MNAATAQPTAPVAAPVAAPVLASTEAAPRETSWITAPDYDDDHPEELVYRPFPLAPLLTATASADDPALAVLQHPDAGKALAMIETGMTSPPMRLRPGQQTTELLWSKEFRGQAVSTADMTDAALPQATPSAGGVTDRLVKTTSR